ncbi:glycerol ethanol, ferric requiring protein, partial [Serendipita sp. 400]
MSHERVNISTQTHNVDEELESRKYADFTTIDWMQDATLERNRRLRSLAELQPAAARGPNGEITTQWFWRHIKKVAINSQSWFVVSLAGAIIGVNAALISITTEWLSDIKMGYCKDGWWLNQEFCCWENQKNEGAACDAWTSWSSFAVVQWFAYVLFAALFSFTAAYLVRAFARYAAGSGISEIKCILAGFVMKGYLGAWTFFIKSLTLPLVIASGLSVGKEGPSVHVACCIGYLCEGGGDYEDLCQSWAQWRMANSLLLATIFRILLVIVSYGCKVPAGIFIPSMAIGATFGRMVGILVKAIYRQYPESGWFAVCDPNIPCITPGTYAFLGAAAALSGVMRITVTVVVVMFELTGALTYILPTMIVLLVTKAVGDWFGMAGIADEMIKFNGYPFLEQEDITFNIPVSRVMRRQLHTMSARGMTLQEVERKLDETSVNGYPVVAPDGHRALLGYIGRTELRYVLDRAQESQHLEPDTLCEFLSEAQSNNLEVGRSSRRAGGHSGIMAEPPSAGPDG